jgi:hypothetical protein
VIGAITAGLYGTGVPPVTSSYESIATVLVGSGGSSSISFSSIPSGFKHLQVRMRTKTTNSLDINFRFNGDTGNNYTSHGIYGDGSSAQAITPYISTSTGYIGYSPSINGASILDVLDYSETTKYKTCRTLHGNDNNGTGYMMLNSSVWLSTSAITSMTILVASGTFEINSSFALYGIKG